MRNLVPVKYGQISILSMLIYFLLLNTLCDRWNMFFDYAKLAWMNVSNSEYDKCKPYLYNATLIISVSQVERNHMSILGRLRNLRYYKLVNNIVYSYILLMNAHECVSVSYCYIVDIWIQIDSCLLFVVNRVMRWLNYQKQRIVIYRMLEPK